MKTLEKKAKRINEEVTEIMDLYMKTISISDMFEYIDDDQLVIIKKSIKVYNDALELQQEQAKMIDELDAKLDIIINKLNKLEGKGL